MMPMLIAHVAVLTATLCVSVAAQCDPSAWAPPIDGVYNTTSRIDPSKLNVHLIPHSHDDPGWLLNVDEYYVQKVQYILDTAVEELVRNPDRRFMFVEQSFFQRWWHEQGTTMQRVVKRLVHEGRLDLTANGGWVMHDEATTHYIAMIDQTAYGHAFLMHEFGLSPRIGWQIDPFGHSATQGSLLSHGVGLDALYFGRIDYQDFDARSHHKELEMLWRPSKSRGRASQVFTGDIIDSYCPPHDFSYGDATNEIQDDAMLHDYDVCQVVNDFVTTVETRGHVTRGNHVFLPMGCDFQYDNARQWFKNMDKLLHYVNQDARVHVLYSNLSYYTDTKRALGLAWSVKTDDFLPYASARHEYWTGYFTSRPALKRFTRVANLVLQQTRQLDAIYQSHQASHWTALERAVALVQHHDGVSGTEKQKVANDYALRLNDGLVAAEKALNNVLDGSGDAHTYRFCLRANTSVCDVATQNTQFEVLVHNALARKRIETVSLPITHPAAKVEVLTGSATVRAQNVYVALPVHPETKVAPYSLVFSVELDPLSTSRFVVTQTDTRRDQDTDENENEMAGTTSLEDVVVLENELMRAEINKTTGLLTKVANKKKNLQLPLSLDVAYYQAFQGEGPKSGAYLFRPDSATTYPVTGANPLDVTMVELQPSVADKRLKSVPRVAFKIGRWVTLEYRMNDDDKFVEIEWTVGPVPIEDKQGKEVILRFDTGKSIASKGTLYTDSNGLEFMKRVRNHRDSWNLTLHDNQEAVAANYFPITTGAYIKDDRRQLNVVTDRAQGAASLVDGQIEVMVHRRLLEDDCKGVSEHLNETESVYDTRTKTYVTKGLVVRGNLFVTVDAADDGMRSLRSKMEAQFFRPLIMLRNHSRASHVAVKRPWLTVKAFPPNIGLTTLQLLSKRCLLVRLTHLYAVDEHASLSTPATVDFSKLFSVHNLVVSEVTELVLTGTKELRSMEHQAMEWKTTDDDAYGWSPRSLPVKKTSVTLQAMEVRAFRLCFAKSSKGDTSDGGDAQDAVEAALQDLVKLLATE
ncbi:hypothetical protein PsorP6_007121 [Peronosclerospora sorghi]|uniref:Uncharacterized protein n=1 Tax=Peronosclerospora sorghi TaxID=230839 RepID=A0ACC0WC64_9STRA|nr:hypothetical protein PsorP6_007121 [Peronosclerospora sorghi]